MTTTPKQEQSHNARAPGGEPRRDDPRAIPGAEDEQSGAPNEPSNTAASSVQTQSQPPADRGRGMPSDPTLDMNEEIDEEDEEEESPTKAL
ncbi:MAG TPA: hypothetical protein VNS34_05700 [Rhizobiaceae bacterium]|nr:hypothetical protein [Rhizobiaceae bacterium]